MNRQQRRKKGIKEKPAVYNMTVDQIERDRQRAILDAQKHVEREVRRKTFIKLIALPLLTMHDEFGFGKKRLKKFATEFVRRLRDLDNNEFTLEQVVEQLELEAGLKFSLDKDGFRLDEEGENEN